MSAVSSYITCQGFIFIAAAENGENKKTKTIVMFFNINLNFEQKLEKRQLQYKLRKAFE